MIRLSEPIDFDWDEGNRDKNWLKHQVSNNEAEEVFFDAHKLLALDVAHSAEGEARYILLGQTRVGRRLTVIFTLRGERVRVISARVMSRREGILYDEAYRATQV